MAKSTLVLNMKNATREFRIEAARLAQNEEALKELSESKDSDIRAEVAKNAYTPDEILIILSKDRTPIVKAGVAKNSKATPEILKRLSKDRNYNVKKEVAQNPHTPQEDLFELSKETQRLIFDDFVELIAQNSNTSEENLRYLSRDISSYVRQRVAQNSHTPVDILENFSKSKNESWYVKEIAQKRLESLKKKNS